MQAGCPWRDRREVGSGSRTAIQNGQDLVRFALSKRTSWISAVFSARPYCPRRDLEPPINPHRVKVAEAPGANSSANAPAAAPSVDKVGSF